MYRRNCSQTKWLWALLVCVDQASPLYDELLAWKGQITVLRWCESYYELTIEHIRTRVGLTFMANFAGLLLLVGAIFDPDAGSLRWSLGAILDYCLAMSSSPVPTCMNTIDLNTQPNHVYVWLFLFLNAQEQASMGMHFHAMRCSDSMLRVASLPELCCQVAMLSSEIRSAS